MPIRRGGGAPRGNRNAAGPHKGKGAGLLATTTIGELGSAIFGGVTAKKGTAYQRNFAKGSAAGGVLNGIATGAAGGYLYGGSPGVIATHALINGIVRGSTGYGAAKLGQYIANRRAAKKLTKTKGNR